VDLQSSRSTPAIESRFFRQPLNNDNKHAQTPLSRLSRFSRKFSGRLNRRSQAQFPSPDLVRLVRLVRTFLHRPGLALPPTQLSILASPKRIQRLTLPCRPESPSRETRTLCPGTAELRTGCS